MFLCISEWSGMSKARKSDDVQCSLNQRISPLEKRKKPPTWQRSPWAQVSAAAHGNLGFMETKGIECLSHSWYIDRIRWELELKVRLLDVGSRIRSQLVCLINGSFWHRQEIEQVDDALTLMFAANWNCCTNWDQLQSSPMVTQSGLEPMVHGTQTWLPPGPTVGGPRNRYNQKSD